MVPPFPCEFGCVQQPAVDFVGEDHREEKVAAVAAFGLRDRKTGRDVVARVPRLPAEIKVVEVEITYGGAVGKSSKVGCRPPLRPNHGRHPAWHGERDVPAGCLLYTSPSPRD